MESQWDQPAPDEIEVSVFSRGSGECIVVHVGDGLWLVVDSFVVNSRPIASIYFDELGIDVSNQVKLILATHWHDDHIRGISNLAVAANNAMLAMPLAMLQPEFKAFASKFHGVAAGKVKSGVNELGRFFEVASSRQNLLELVRSWLTLFDFGPGDFSHGLPVKVQALSPSNADCVEFLGRIGAYVLPNNVAVSAPYYDENDVSVALHIDLGNQSILLGADLESRSHPDRGWDGVFNDHRCPGRSSTLYKVAHHGSVTGHHDDVWSKLCVERPVSTLTPWARGDGRLPKPDDVKRILALSSDAFTAAKTVTSGKRVALQAVNSILHTTNSVIRNVDTTVGHTRHRLVHGVWQTVQFGSAVPLKQIAA